MIQSERHSSVERGKAVDNRNHVWLPGVGVGELSFWTTEQTVGSESTLDEG